MPKTAPSRIELEKHFGVVCISLPTPFPVGPVKVFLVKHDPPILIDTGLNSEESYGILSERLAEHGLKLNDLGAVLVTHGHRDHVGLLGRLMRETKADSYGHPLVRTLGRDADNYPQARKEFYLGILEEFGVPSEIKEEANSFYEKFRTFSEPFDLAHVLEDGEQALGYTAYHVPGHSPSDTLLTQPELGITFVGDHILPGTNPNPTLQQPEPGQSRSKSLVLYQRSLARTRELDLGICLPGHGEPFEDHVAVVDRILERQERRGRQVMKLMKSGKRTPYEISRGLFPDLPAQHIHLGLSIAVGHMEAQEECGEAHCCHVDGILQYQPL
ncbi:MAG: MBL fold metallo-hydrolase [Candidatus Hydrogenedentes bacterium]|nr:MBL fold metallo-hydrolase [Candidatus Hydrogenedentota bacterium]